MKVKMRLGIALLIACLPWLAMAQNDDLYFVPKKEKKANRGASGDKADNNDYNDNGIGFSCNNGSGKGCDGEDARY